MRVLVQMGVVEPPRSVPGPTYVEKCYHLPDETRAALHLDYAWYERMRDPLTAEERKTLFISFCLNVSNVLRQTARDYESLDVESFDRALRDDKLILVSLNRVGRQQLQSRLSALRSLLADEAREFAEDLSPREDLVVTAALPLLDGLDGGGMQAAE
jgi:hypothetical protein